MTESARIADQLDRAFRRDPWHGPALMELLAGADAAAAAAHRLHHTHSIWEIVLHLTAWHRAVLRRMKGQATELKGEQDWPPVRRFNDEEWEAAVRALEDSHVALYDAVRALPDSRLSEQVPGRNHDLYFMLHGVAQHTAYHAGQIALLKKSG